MIALSELTTAEREDFEERAAIREFSGKQGREAAERGALEDVLRQRQCHPDGVESQGMNGKR